MRLPWLSRKKLIADLDGQVAACTRRYEDPDASTATWMHWGGYREALANLRDELKGERW